MTNDRDNATDKAPSAKRLTKLRPLAMIFMLVSALGLCLTLTAPQALAQAFGVSPFGPSVVFKGVKLPMGTYAVSLNGRSTHVDNVKGMPSLNTPVGNICNWSMTAEFFDINNNWYKTYTGRVNGGCFNAAKQPTANVIYVNADMKPGKMCSTLKKGGERQTSVCHQIAK